MNRALALLVALLASMPAQADFMRYGDDGPDYLARPLPERADKWLCVAQEAFRCEGGQCAPDSAAWGRLAFDFATPCFAVDGEACAVNVPMRVQANKSSTQIVVDMGASYVIEVLNNGADYILTIQGVSEGILSSYIAMGACQPE